MAGYARGLDFGQNVTSLETKTNEGSRIVYREACAPISAERDFWEIRCSQPIQVDSSPTGFIFTFIYLRYHNKDHPTCRHTVKVGRGNISGARPVTSRQTCSKIYGSSCPLGPAGPPASSPVSSHLCSLKIQEFGMEFTVYTKL